MILLTISHGEKEADIASVKSEFWKNKLGASMKRMQRVLSWFSRGSKNARQNQLIFRGQKTVKTNANGTSGYLVKSGKKLWKNSRTFKKRDLVKYKLIEIWGAEAPRMQNRRINLNQKLN